ncbi:ATP-dependent helicase HepA [Corynebacterium occultum]|uniref:ATP-dependent helicase HepA n=1 Tax=Corynebacterium occultum TaxID=2675219 RepID=A0A6B8WBY6_9CORY|nr:SNF2-related protein [Corynebacterium occultum]QGU07530.1 ATP-dependent helicase HepA [Corynebacterium occultum]
MEKTQLEAILAAADRAIAVAQEAEEAVGCLGSGETATAGTILSGARLEEAEFRVDILPHGALTWPESLYLHLEFSHHPHAADTLVQVIHTCRELPELREKATHAAPGLLGRLFGGNRVKAGQEAAAQMQAMLADPNRRGLLTDAGTLLDKFQRAETLQRVGVRLFPGSHGTPDHLIAGARHALAQALGTENPVFLQWEQSQIQPVLRLAQALRTDPHSEPKLRQGAQAALNALNGERVEVLLRQLPVEALRTATRERLRFPDLSTHGYNSVADVLNASQRELIALNGIGEVTAKRMKAAAQTLHREALAAHHTAIGDTPTTAALRLLAILAQFDALNSLDELERDRRNRVLEDTEHLPLTDSPDPWTVVLNTPEAENQLWQRYTDDLAWARAHPAPFRPAKDLRSRPLQGMSAWEDYLTRPAHYQGLLVSLLQLEVEGGGDLAGDTLARVRALRLDRSHLKDLRLRGYQSFGARFVIVQRKVLLGDEMGLGKTVQALAAAAHIAAGVEKERQKSAHLLVVCPASLLGNWVRESHRFTDLPVHRAHGSDKDTALGQWRGSGGILVCTFDGARTLDIGRIDMIIVDEAHMIKNPETQRSRALQTLITRATYALLMSGTPLENRVSEFAALINYLQPELITPAMATMSATDFRKHIAPAYLRRNQVEVLDELPEKMDQIDWVQLNDADQRHYATAVGEGSWMDIRRAAFSTPGVEPAKLTRIREILEETTEAGRKAIIFTYFREVLSRLAEELGEQVLGTISGSVPPTRRQDLIDALADAPAGSVLLIQITAGGVGLNIQSASVVIIAEPQVKPSIEAQAIARVHRMGQISTVQVHRLVADDTAEERMLDMLADKRRLFDTYARPSESAAIHDAVDISEATLAAEIIAEERQRLGYSTTPPNPGDAGANQHDLHPPGHAASSSRHRKTPGHQDTVTGGEDQQP